jgi:hypothetical protein
MKITLHINASKLAVQALLQQMQTAARSRKLVSTIVPTIGTDATFLIVSRSAYAIETYLAPIHRNELVTVSDGRTDNPQLAHSLLTELLGDSVWGQTALRTSEAIAAEIKGTPFAGVNLDLIRHVLLSRGLDFGTQLPSIAQVAIKRVGGQLINNPADLKNLATRSITAEDFVQPDKPATQLLVKKLNRFKNWRQIVLAGPGALLRGQHPLTVEELKAVRNVLRLSKICFPCPL